MAPSFSLSSAVSSAPSIFSGRMVAGSLGMGAFVTGDGVESDAALYGDVAALAEQRPQGQNTELSGQLPAGGVSVMSCNSNSNQQGFSIC